MEYLLFFVVAFTLLASFFSSLAEASLYSVPLAHVKNLAESGSKIGKILLALKEDIDRPIAAILVMNTVSNTAGPAIAGAIVSSLWGEQAIIYFAAFMTITVLIFSEIIPKLLGVNYSRQAAMLCAGPLWLLVWILTPVLFVTTGIARVLEPHEEEPTVSHEEVLSMAAIGTEEGALDHFEGSVITNVIGLDELHVGDILTPRVVVFRLSDSTKIEEVEKVISEWNYSRVPIHPEGDPDHLTAYVTQRDVFRELLRGNKTMTLKQLSRPLHTVPELMRVDKLLLRMFEKKEHICAVVDEHGALAGLVTLEDIIEEIVGREIVDEYDTVTDLRTFAQLLKGTKTRKRATVHDLKSKAGKLHVASEGETN